MDSRVFAVAFLIILAIASIHNSGISLEGYKTHNSGISLEGYKTHAQAAWYFKGLNFDAENGSSDAEEGDSDDTGEGISGEMLQVSLERLLSQAHNISVGDLSPQVAAFVQKHSDCKGKEFLVQLVFDSKAAQSTHDNLCQRLPTLQEVRKTHGEGPVVVGLETCKIYQDSIKHATFFNGTKISPMPRVGGLYNSGTNALASTFEANFPHVDKPFDKDHPFLSPHDLPWSKHFPAKYRFSRTPRGSISPEYVLPVLVIRNPYYWIPSMCKNSYNLLWTKHRCPSMIDIARNKTFQVSVPENDRDTRNIADRYDTIADLWSTWYRGYIDSGYPFLILRYEDLLLYGTLLVHVVAKCAGLSLDPTQVTVQTEEARGWVKHNPSRGLLASLEKLAAPHLDLSRMPRHDQKYLQKALDPQLLDLFGYPKLYE